MGLKIKIAKGDYEALDDSLKTLYVADGENFKLDADYEDVTGLKNKSAELLAEIKKQKDLIAKFDGIDPAKARDALAALEKLENDKLVSEGDIEKIKQQLTERFNADLEKEKQETRAERERADSVINNLFLEKLTKQALEKGVKPSQLEGAIAHGRFAEKLAFDEKDYSVYKRDGLKEAREVDEIWDAFKTSNPDYFATTLANGSGASGSNGNGGANAPKQLTKAQVQELEPAAKREFYMSGGVVSDRK